MQKATEEDYECPACKGAVHPEWHACPHCGAVYDAPDVPALPPVVSRVAPRPFVVEETEQIAYIGIPGGAKRPITVMSDAPISITTPAPPLRSLLTSTPGVDRIPPEPPEDTGQRRVTILHEVAKPVEEPPRPAQELARPEEEPALELEARTLPVQMPTRQVEAPEATPLQPTVVVVADAPFPSVPQGRRLPDDLAELERIIDRAVRKAFREHAARLAQAPPAQVNLTEAAQAVRGTRRGRLAAGGVGLVLGGIAADVVVLNWDVWIRGDALTAIGWLQQSGLLGAAAFVGAGAAVAALGLSRAWRGKPRAH